MFPIVLDLTRVRIALVGNAGLAAKRLAQLDEAGVRHLTVFADAPIAELEAAAGDRLVRAMPTDADLDAAQIVYAVDIDRDRAVDLAERCRRLGTLVNVEDDKPLCDFHTPSMVRRGDLILSISTGGKSPGLARSLRRHLSTLFGAEWAGRLDRLAEARDRWRAEGADMPTIMRRTERLIDEEGWLK